MRCRPVMLFVLVGLGACGEEGIAPPVSGPAPVLDLAMNGRRTGVFACSEGLTLTGVLANPGPGSVVSNGFTMDVQSLTPECSNTLARTVGVPIEVAAGTTREVLRLDLGGVCAPPAGRPGCSFRGRGEVQTTAGVIAAELTFSTAGTPGTAPGPGNRPALSLAGDGCCHPQKAPLAGRKTARGGAIGAGG